MNNPISMACYVAFLRGINVAGQKKLPMAALREIFVGIGGTAVQSYIQSGNVVFGHKGDSVSDLDQKLYGAIMRTFGFDVRVVVKTAGQLRAIIEQNPFGEEAQRATGNLYFTFLASTPEKEQIESLQGEVFEGEAFKVTADCVYLFFRKGMGKARLNNNLLEQRLKVAATTRNHRTVMKVMALCDTHGSA